MRRLLAVLISFSPIVSCPVYAQDYDIFSFDPFAAGPWSEVGRTTLNVPKVPNNSITLDGAASSAEYGGFVAITVTPGVNAWIMDFPEDREWLNEADSSFSFWLAHDDNNLYVGVHVKDDVVNSDDPNASFWRDDSIEFVVDALNDRFDGNTDSTNDPYGGHSYINYLGRFSVWDDTAGAISGTTWATEVPWAYGQNGDVYASGKEVTGGWQLEVRFSKKLFEDPEAGNKLRNGYRMGFNIGLDDDDKHGTGTNGDGSRGEDLEIQYWWANRQRYMGLNQEYLDTLTEEDKRTRNHLASLQLGIDQTGRLAHGGSGEILFAYDTPVSGDILYVTSNGASPINADPSIIALLEGKGYTVTRFTADASTPDDLRAAAEGKDLVILSESIGSTSVVDPAGDATGVFSLKDTDVPVISFEAFMFDNADWTLRTEDGSNNFIDLGNSGRSEVDPIGLGDARDSIYIKNTSHPITAGLTAGLVPLYTELYSFTFGVPSEDADVLATIDEAGEYPALFVYEEGDELPDGSTAPNKRIGLFIGQAANPTVNYAPDLAMLNEAGMNLFLNTIAYAIGTSTATPTLSVTRNGNNLVITYAGGTLQSADTINGTWTNESGASPLTVEPSGARKFYRVRG